MKQRGGWWRLWVVGSGFVLLLTFVVTLLENDYYDDGVNSAACIPGTLDRGVRTETTWVRNPQYFPPDGSMTMGEAVDGAKKWERLLAERGLGQSSEYALPVTESIPTFACASWKLLGSTMLAALGLILALLLIGLAARWIFRGFRK